MSALTILLIISTVLAAFNVCFYARFWFYTRTWGSAMMALFPVVLLASRALELRKLEALAMGGNYVPSDTERILVGLAGLVVCLIQAMAVLFRYDRLLREIKAERK
ncbi:MAG: hypothetical protein PHO41_10920 [Eubacteriales bacterium]|nr:hypothetical protein [Eubacteriales bacterium]